MNNKNKIEMQLKDGTTEHWDHQYFARWASLIEGIQTVDQKLKMLRFLILILSG